MSAGAAAVAPGPAKADARRQTRLLLSATAVDTFGSGLNYAILSLFLVRAVGLSGTAAGIVIGVAAGIALPGGYLTGRVVDAIGPRRPLIGSYCLQGVAAALLPLASGPVGACLALSALMFFTEGSRATRYALIARIGPEGGVRLRGRSTVVSNVAVAVGVGVGGLLVGIGDPWLLRCGLWANAATFLVAALFQQRLAELPAAPGAGGTAPLATRPTAGSPFRDTGYLRVVLVNAVLMIQAQILTIGYPLWVASSGRVPLWTTSVLFVLNTLLVVTFQMRVVGQIGSHGDAAAGWRRAGLLFLLGCTVTGVVVGFPALPWAATLTLVLAAVTVHTFGEIWHGSGQFFLALGLAEPTQQGRYQGLFNLGEGVAGFMAPLFVGYLCTGAGAWGWIGLGVALASAGLAAGPVVRSAERNRPYPEAEAG
jgi:MFS family permease